jgi:Flp pilus assembly protein TadB
MPCETFAPPVAAAAKPQVRRSWHAYRWRLEPFFYAPFLGMIFVASAILYVIVASYGTSVLAVVLLIAAIALIVFLWTTRTPRVKRPS